MFFETTLTNARIDDRRQWWPNERLHDALLRANAANPDKVAAVDVHGQLTYRELVEQADACAAGLLGLGVRHGDVVSVQLPNWNEFVVVMLGVERIGAIVNPIAPIFRHHELRVMFRLAQPTVVVTCDEFRGFSFPQMHQELAGDVASLRHLVVVGDRTGADTLSWTDLLDAGRASGYAADVLDLLAPAPTDLAEIIFTSGTTGEPKGVMHTHDTLMSPSLAMLRAQQGGDRDVIHMASTFAHQTGYLFGARMFIQCGGTGVFQDLWDPAAFVKLIEREQVTMSFGAAPFLSDLLRAPNLADHDISSFRVFGCFGAPIPTPLLEQARDRLPCRVMPGWGMSEVALATTTRTEDPMQKVVGTDGAPFPGNAVRVVDSELRDVEPGTEGDLLCKGAFEFVGYVQGRAFSDACYVDGDWFVTGDRAKLDADGFVRITGRSKDLIIRAGENVPVKEIEDIIARHPSVAAVALVGVPHPRLGEIGCAFVIPEGEAPTLEEVREFLAAQQVTPQFWPERVVACSEFPMTPSGKVQKFKLRDQAGAT